MLVGPLMKLNYKKKFCSFKIVCLNDCTRNNRKFCFLLTMCGKKPYEVMIKPQEFCYFCKVFHFEHSSNDKVSARSPPKICAFLQSMPLGPLKISKCTQKSFCPSTNCALMTIQGLTESFALSFNNVCHKSQ